MSGVSLHVIDPEHYFPHILKLLKDLPEDENILYITTNKPYKHLNQVLTKKDIPTNNFFFIDCISKKLGEKEEKHDNCIFIESPQNLTAISIAIDELVDSFEGKKILFLDSLSVLLMYNDATTIGKFSNFLVNKMRLKNVDTIILALESDMDKDIIKQIEAVVDKVET